MGHDGHSQHQCSSQIQLPTRHSCRLGQDQNPAAITVANKIKLVRKVQADDHMEVNGNE
jgi:hypothetical protein